VSPLSSKLSSSRAWANDRQTSAAGSGGRARASRSHPLTGEPRAQQQQNGNGQQCHEDENEKRYQNISEHDFTSRSSAAGGWFLFLRNNSCGLAMFAAIRRTSSGVSGFGEFGNTHCISSIVKIPKEFPSGFAEHSLIEEFPLVSRLCRAQFTILRLAR
jgi:hypothetical protein